LVELAKFITDHMDTVWLPIGGSVRLQTVGPKSVHSGNGWPLIALQCLLLMLVRMPLHILER